MKKRLRVLAAGLIVLAGASIVFGVFYLNIDSKYAADRDFISYWSAGQLLAHGQNPYDYEAVKTLEVKAGRDPRDAMFVMRNPPDALFLTLPFGYIGPKMGMIVWIFVMIGLLLGASFMIWRLNGSPDSLTHLFGFAFAPVLTCFMDGQVGIILLLGVVLFLYFWRSRPFVAGASLLLCAIKPHLFGPFWIALLLSGVVDRKSRQIIAGLGTAIAASCGFAYLLDPKAWVQYSQMMRAGGALNEPIPVMSVLLRSLIAPHAVWIQFAPEAAACVWAGWYFWSHRAEWDWADHGLVVLLAGVVCTPYGWFTDEAVVLPALLAGTYRGQAAHRPMWPLGLIAGAALAELMMSVPINTRFYIWTPLMWFGWYLYATGRLGPRRVAAVA